VAWFTSWRQQNVLVAGLNDAPVDSDDTLLPDNQAKITQSIKGTLDCSTAAAGVICQCLLGRVALTVNTQAR
jgi:hypothetical protein